MPTITNRPVYASQVKVGDYIITDHGIDIVTQSAAHGIGWGITTRWGRPTFNHTTKTIGVVDIAIYREAKASDLLVNDLVIIDSVWHQVKAVEVNEESKRKLDITLMRLDSDNAVEVISVGHKKQFNILDK